MAVIYRIRPFLWMQICKACIFALTQIQALSNQQSALSPRNILNNHGGRL